MSGGSKSKAKGTREQRRQRKMLQAVLETEQKEQAALTEVVLEHLNGDARRDQVCQSLRVGLVRQVETILTRLENVGGSLASPESTPTLPPSGS